MSLKDAILNLLELLRTYLQKSSKDERPDDPSKIDLPDDGAPKIITVKGVKYNTHGSFKTTSGKPKGAVVHYTVSGRTPKSAEGVVRYLASKGLGCLVMDEDGVFYAPEGYDFLKHVVYHAGVSTWKNVSGVSFYCVGIEICNWGTDARAHKVTDVRIISHQKENQKPGTYQMYTEAQEKSLIRFLNYMKKASPDFSVDWVVGHDEIAPTRKSDPGGSLSVTMPELRSKLKGR